MTLAEIRELARQAHGEQRDPDGSLHFLHCERVAEAVSGFEAKAAAYLHDVLEDTVLTAADLRARGVPGVVVQAVELLTRPEDELYPTYLRRIGAQIGDHADLARIVKVTDAADNLRRSLAGGQHDRAEKYRQALKYLTARGCPFCASESLIRELRDSDEPRWGRFGGWVVCASCSREWPDRDYWATGPGWPSPAQELPGKTRPQS